MFRKFFIFALFATACGYAFASDCTGDCVGAQQIWPAPGSDADVQFDGSPDNSADPDNIRIVSKVGEDMVVENNFNITGRGGEFWSGGADLTQLYQAPSGFNAFASQAEMPLMHTEMIEDDGGAVLAVSRSGRQNVKVPEDGVIINGASVAASSDYFDVEEADAPKSGVADAQVRSWVVASGQSLREVLQEWCDKEGWDLVWNTSREYPIQASAVFKGRFMDVSSALVRNFSRANPIPYAKFFKGNRVLIVTTTEE